jgi:hypothetical protein
MSAVIDKNYVIDTRRLEYREPTSGVARLVQRPLHDINGYSLADAYMRDFRKALNAGRKALEGGE